MSDIEKILTARFKHIIEQEKWNVNDLFPTLEAGGAETNTKNVDPITCCCVVVVLLSIVGIIYVKCTTKSG